MKINYPIKYAAMPIIEQVGWVPALHNLERKYEVVCYIVSKCYLISDSTRYTENGVNIREYEVVFPYQPGDFDKWNRVVPCFNLYNGMCTNSNRVDLIFDSYEETLKYVKIKNIDIYNKECMHLPATDDLLQKLEEKKEEHEKRISKYTVLEEQILNYTTDMEVGKQNYFTKVIKRVNNNFKLMDCSIYKIFELFDSDAFAVYKISKEEYAKLTTSVSQIEVESLDKASRPLAIHKSKDDFILLATNKDRGTYYINNKKLCCDFGLTEVSEEDFRNIGENAYIFYTTEPIDDILKSYATYEEIDLSRKPEPVLKKSKNNKRL